jgi:hypothetical protein
VDETYVKIKAKWHYLYRAVDKHGKTAEFLLRRDRGIAALIAVYGLFMTPIGWGWSLFVWGYALAWFLVNDRVKLLAYRVFDPTAAWLRSVPI